MQRISDGDDYPAGKLNDLAVCYFLKTESGWMFMPVDDRSEADKTLRGNVRPGGRSVGYSQKRPENRTAKPRSLDCSV